MNDKDFDKIFSKKLKEEKIHPVDEKGWEVLASQLDADDRRKVVGGVKTRPLLWLLPLLFLLLGINVWSLVKMGQAEKHSVVLENELKGLKTVLLKHDTLIQIQYIYKTDTVFIPSNNTQKFDKNTSFNAFQLENEGSIAGNNPPLLSRSGGIGFQGFQADSEALNTLNAGKSYENKVIKTTNNIIENPPTLIKGNKNEVNTIENEITQNSNSESSKRQTPFSILTELPTLKNWVRTPETRPELLVLRYPVSISSPIIENKKVNRFYIGLNGGFINYHTLWLNRDGLEIGRDEKSYQVGLKTEYALTSNWRLTASADYCPYDFKIKWLDSRYNLPPMPNYYNPATSTLNSIIGSQKMYLGSLGIKYIFNTNTRLQPYLATAYSAMRIEPYDAEYTFTQTATGKTYTNKTHLDGGADVQKIALLSGGLEYRVFKHFVLQTEGFYYKDMNKTKKTFDLFGLRGAVLIGF
jgi:hypothetical protein